MSRGGRGGGGGGAQSGAMQLVSFDLLKDLGSGNLFNVNTALFPVSYFLISSKHVTYTVDRKWMCLFLVSQLQTKYSNGS